MVEYPSLLCPKKIQRTTGQIGTHRERVSDKMGENAYRVDEELGFSASLYNFHTPNFTFSETY